MFGTVSIPIGQSLTKLRFAKYVFVQGIGLTERESPSALPQCGKAFGLFLQIRIQKSRIKQDNTQHNR